MTQCHSHRRTVAASAHGPILAFAAMLLAGGCETIDRAMFPPLPTRNELLDRSRADIDQKSVADANATLQRLSDRSTPIMGAIPRANSGLIGEVDLGSSNVGPPAAAGVESRGAPQAAARTGGASRGQVAGGPREVRTAGDDVATPIEFDLVDSSLRSVIELVFRDYIRRPFTILGDFQDKQVNLLLSGSYTRREVMRMFESFLDAHGVSLAEAGGVVTVATRPLRAAIEPAAGQAMGIWKLRHVDVKEVLPVARQFLTNADRGLVVDGSNVLVASGSSNEIRQIDNLVGRIDTTFFQGKSIIVYGPRYVTAPALVTLLQNLPRGLGSNLADSKRNISAEIVTGEQRVVVVADSPEMRAIVLSYIDTVDRPGQNDRRVFFYPLRNQKAEDIRTTVDSLLTPIFAERQKIGLVANQATNTLLVTATAEEYFEVKRVLDALDFQIPTVLIDATIVEVQLRDSLAYGVQWFLSRTSGSSVVDVATNLTNNTVVPSGTGATGGMSINVIQLGNNTFATLDLLASQTDLRVLSRPRVLVQNSQQATIKSTDQIRVLQSVVATSATVGGSSLPQRSFIDKEVGVSLEVTPVIAEDGTISMKLKVQDSRRGADDLSSGERQPTFNVREINTTLMVQNGETILIGGLIRSQNDRREQHIPLLGRIPLIGRAFANTTDVNEATELIVFVQPTVILDRTAARIMTDAIRNSGGATSVSPR